MLVILLFFTICALLYVMANKSYKVGNFQQLRAPKNKFLFYLVQFTWGLPMNVLGAIACLIFMLCGIKPRLANNCLYFALKVNFGTSLGIFIIEPDFVDEHLRKHELGHSIQNFWFGVFTPFMVAIPSFIRFWYRDVQKFFNKKCSQPPYDNIWFEGQATNSGSAYINEKEGN